MTRRATATAAAAPAAAADFAAVFKFGLGRVAPPRKLSDKLRIFGKVVSQLSNYSFDFRFLEFGFWTYPGVRVSLGLPTLAPEGPRTLWDPKAP